MILSATPAAVTLDESGKGKVTVGNETALPLQLTFSVIRTGGSAVTSATVAGPPGGRLDPGAVSTAAIEAPGAPAKSTLVVVAAPTGDLSRGFVLRVPLQTSEPAKPAVAEWTIRKVHWDGTQGSGLPLDGTCGGLGIKNGNPVGTLNAEGIGHAVTASCKSPTASSLALAFPTLGADGRTYKGKLTLGEAEVALTVEGTWPWWGVLALLILGILAALAVGAWRGWGRTATELLRRTFLIQQLVADRNPNSSDKSFARAAAQLNLPQSVQRWTIAKAVTDKLGELRGRVRGWRAPGEDDLAEVRDELDQLEPKLRDWPKLANRLAELKRRSERLGDLETYWTSIQARTLVREGPLDIDGMADVTAATEEALKLAYGWPWEQIQHAKRIAETLPPDDEAVATFAAVRKRFHDAPNDDAAIAVIPAFEAAYEALREARAGRFAAPGITAAEAPGPERWLGMTEWVEVDDPALTAQSLAIKIVLFDMLVLGLLTLVAIVAGMQALWIDKTFGGFWDIAAAVVWGATAATVAAPLGAALGDMRQSWRNLDAEPPPAS